MAKQAKPPPRRLRTARANGARDPRPRAASGVRIVLTTAPSKGAAAIARALVDARVAACVNLVAGVTSVYRWKGRVERARETLLVVKTTRGALGDCRRLLARVHPYDVPEIVVLTPAAVEPRYADWVRASTR